MNHLIQPSHIEAVKQFRLTSGLPVSDTPIMLSNSAIEHHVKLMREEVEEYEQATDLVGKFDAIIDCAYYFIGAYLHAGKPKALTPELSVFIKFTWPYESWVLRSFNWLVKDAIHQCLIFDQLFMHVHNANMSKFCHTEAEAIASQDKYFREGKETRPVKVNDLWVIKHYDGSQSKVLKGINFAPPEFNIEKTLRAYGILKDNLPLEAAKLADDEQS